MATWAIFCYFILAYWTKMYETVGKGSEQVGCSHRAPREPARCLHEVPARRDVVMHCGVIACYMTQSSDTSQSHERPRAFICHLPLPCSNRSHVACRTS